ncbi:hypothetical protein [Clostridium botulinum]|uniref:Uncharacterized protein n=1 Tax=Clostridium botulinum TaxID=1491 RepID=A0A9Q1UY67_CLOBO|nr:hypothetical protein [Clostridium botulinum]AEB76821.1 hypothetical protein CbC4_2156 [Clostridium botulinum BKT015925]KEI02596.1 hypothetical protein Z953_06850 [Clostridium botulinum D str. 16868]KEI02699.1 hypothetical protein Y848_06880 [Clostridium botulinum C/D str. Sp77]KLU74750.1 hypothetical protein CBC3_12580 [Clostridium botulinum V891]KOA76954.1 hypothetical protein ADU78_05180 [Clostridium botulinum]
MLRLFFIETKKCIGRLRTQLIFFSLFIITIISYVMSIHSCYGDSLSNMRSASELGFIQSVESRFLYHLLVMIAPLIACLIYSDTYCEDYKTGVYKSILTKVEKKHYYLSKALVNFLVTFFVFFIPLIINEILCLITFPKKGYFNNFGLPSYDIGYSNFNSDWMLDLLRIKSLFLYSLTYIVIISLFAALFSVLAFSIQLYYKKNRFAVPAAMFIGYMLLSILGNVIGVADISILHCMQSGVQGKFWSIPPLQLLLMVVSLLLIFNKSRREIDI